MQTESDQTKLSWAQKQEIELGRKQKLDTSLYADPDYLVQQMREIRKGLEQKLDVSIYASKEFDCFQMAEIRRGLADELVVSEYAKPEYSYVTMREVRMAQKDGVNLTDALAQGYRDEQLEQLRLARENHLPLIQYTSSQMYPDQMREIRLGLEEELNVELYASVQFSWYQMREIRLGLEERLDVAVYATPYFTYQQMAEIRLGLQAGYKVDSYAKLMYSAKEMRKRRKYLMENKDRVLQEAVPGKDGYYEYFFRTEPKRAPKILEDGSVDYRDVDAFEVVKAGTVVARYHPPTKGRDGIDAEGNIVQAPAGLEKPVLKGKGFVCDDDKRTYRAKISGKIELKNDQIIIEPILIINEDVDGLTGKVRFDGAVILRKSLHVGGYIEATGDVVIEHNMEAGTIISGGNVLIKRGVSANNRGQIRAVGTVQGNFFEAVSIETDGNLLANYLMNCMVYIKGKVVVSGRRGSILGGYTGAEEGIEAGNVGNPAHIKTKLECGYSMQMQTEQRKWEDKKERRLQDVVLLEESIKQLTHKIAKIQDKKSSEAVKIEEMEKKIFASILQKKAEIVELDEKLAHIAEYAEREVCTPIYVRGKAYPGCVVMIDGINYQLPQELSNFSFRKREREIVLFRNTKGGY